MIAETLNRLAIAVKALETIAEEDYPFAPITDHSALQFFIKTAKEALEEMNLIHTARADSVDTMQDQIQWRNEHEKCKVNG